MLALSRIIECNQLIEIKVKVLKHKRINWTKIDHQSSSFFLSCIMKTPLADNDRHNELTTEK